MQAAGAGASTTIATSAANGVLVWVVVVLCKTTGCDPVGAVAAAATSASCKSETLPYKYVVRAALAAAAASASNALLLLQLLYSTYCCPPTR